MILVTCYFPPDGGAGAQRPRRLATYAREQGWEMTVVTRAPMTRRTTWEPEDESLVSDGYDEAVIHRVPMPNESAAGQMVPGLEGVADPFLASVVERVRDELATRPADAIVLTMPPYGMAPVVPALRPLTDAPILVDLQDPWALDGAPAYSHRAQWARNDAWMREVLEMADGVIANTPEARTQLVKAIPGLDDDRVAVVNNGCTFADFQGPMPPRPAKMKEGVFHLVHTGTLHSAAFERTRGLVGRLRRWRNHRAEPVQISGRTAWHLLRAIDRVGRDDAGWLDNFQLSLVGVEDAPTRRMIDRSPCRDLVNLVGFVPYNDAVAWIRHADALFVPLFGLPAGHRSRIIPSKTYEYLASGRPILGALPEGDARDLIDRSERGVSAAPCDEAALADALKRVMELARSHPPGSETVDDWACQYDWPRLCEQFFAFASRIAHDRSSVAAAG